MLKGNCVSISDNMSTHMTCTQPLLKGLKQSSDMWLWFHCNSSIQMRVWRYNTWKSSDISNIGCYDSLLCGVNHCVSNSLRYRLQVERAEERCVLDLLDRGWRSTRGGWRVTACSFTTGASLAPTLWASSGRRPGGCGTGRTLALVRAVPSTWVWSILYGTVDKKCYKLLYYKIYHEQCCLSKYRQNADY